VEAPAAGRIGFSVDMDPTPTAKKGQTAYQRELGEAAGDPETKEDDGEKGKEADVEAREKKQDEA